MRGIIDEQLLKERERAHFLMCIGTLSTMLYASRLAYSKYKEQGDEVGKVISETKLDALETAIEALKEKAAE